MFTTCRAQLDGTFHSSNFAFTHAKSLSCPFLIMPSFCGRLICFTAYSSWAACILSATSNTALKLSGDFPLSALAPPLSSPLCCAMRRLGSVVIPV